MTNVEKLTIEVELLKRLLFASGDSFEEKIDNVLADVEWRLERAKELEEKERG